MVRRGGQGRGVTGRGGGAGEVAAVGGVQAVKGLELGGPCRDPVRGVQFLEETVDETNSVRWLSGCEGLPNGGGRVPRGRGRRSGVPFGDGGGPADVVEGTVSEVGGVKGDQVWVAGDIGRQMINPSVVDNQGQGAVLDGISEALYQEITFENGRTKQNNFNDYKLLRMPAAAKVELHWKITDNAPTGLGDPALPPVIPALCNAIFMVTGERVRTLPMS